MITTISGPAGRQVGIFAEDLRTSGRRNDLLERDDQGWQVMVHDLP